MEGPWEDDPAYKYTERGADEDGDGCCWESRLRQREEQYGEPSAC